MVKILTDSERKEALIIEQMEQDMAGELVTEHTNQISEQVLKEYDAGYPIIRVNPEVGDVLLFSDILAGSKKSKQLCVVNRLGDGYVLVNMISRLEYPVYFHEVKYEIYVVDMLRAVVLPMQMITTNCWKIDNLDTRITDALFAGITNMDDMIKRVASLDKLPEFTIGQYFLWNKNPEIFTQYDKYVLDSIRVMNIGFMERYFKYNK